jgi:hypothetical protein
MSPTLLEALRALGPPQTIHSKNYATKAAYLTNLFNKASVRGLPLRCEPQVLIVKTEIRKW